MNDMVGAASNRPSIPRIYDVKDQRRMHRDRGMQGRRWLPGAIAHSCDIVAGRTGRVKWEPAAVASDQMARPDHAAHLHLQTFDGRIDKAGGGTREHLLAHHMPRFNGLT